MRASPNNYTQEPIKYSDGMNLSQSVAVILGKNSDEENVGKLKYAIYLLFALTNQSHINLFSPSHNPNHS